MSVPWSRQPRPLPPVDRVGSLRAWDLDLFSFAHEALVVDGQQNKKEGSKKHKDAFQQNEGKFQQENKMEPKEKEDEGNIKEEECDSVYSSASSTDGNTMVKLPQIPALRNEIDNDKKVPLLKRNVPCADCGNDSQHQLGIPGSFCISCKSWYDGMKRQDMKQLPSPASLDLATNMSLAYRSQLANMLGYTGLKHQSKGNLFNDFDLNTKKLTNSSIDDKSSILSLNSENISEVKKFKLYLEKAFHEVRKQQTQIEENNGLCESKKYKQCELEKSVEDFRRIHESMLNVDEMKRPDDLSTNVNRNNKPCDNRIDLGKTRLHHENLVYSNKSSKNSYISSQFRNSKKNQISRYSIGITNRICDSNETIGKSKYLTDSQIKKNHPQGFDKSLVLTEYVDFMSEYKKQTRSSSLKPLVQTPKKSMEELQQLLEPSDVQEIVLLEELLKASYGKLPESARVHYPCCDKMTTAFQDFVQRRTYFYSRLPCCSHIDPEHRAAQLRQAVSMSCHVTGAQWIDPVTFQWPDFRACCAGIPHLEASQLRKVLPKDDFIKLMTFYKNYYQYFSDERATLLVMNLLPFLPQQGSVSASKTLEEGKTHYTDILARYLKAVHGPEEGIFFLSKIHESFVLIQELVESHRNVDLIPSVVNEGENEDRKENLNKSLIFLCESLSSAIIERNDTKEKQLHILGKNSQSSRNSHVKCESISEELQNVNCIDTDTNNRKKIKLDNFNKNYQQQSDREIY
ncbi:unnamed protein product [Meganyctiphanes norvegica]|uniref:Uncharacterized protein n=1 Tax=Meganyctiphanes norvegica TaxID=48144 RepID=A0AAV2PPP5_MEGNR